MKIVHILPSLNIGGAEKFTVDLCNELAKSESNEVILISIRNNDPQNPSNFLRKLNQKKVQYITLNKGLGLDITAFLRLTKLLKKIQPAIVHTHTNAFEYANFFRLLSSKTKFFHTIHSLAPQECPNQYVKRIRHWFYKKNNHTPITISPECAQSFQSYYHLNNEILIENGCKPAMITQEYSQIATNFKTEGEFLFLCVGRIEEVKNHVLAAAAIEKITKESNYKCKLLILGDERDQAIVEQLKQYENTEIIGFKDNVGDYLKTADAFCISSTREGLPISLIEAMSIGTISINTNVGGIPSVIQNGYNGFLTTAVTEEAYIRSIMDFLETDNTKKGIISKNAIKTFDERYHIEYCAAKHLEHYAEN